MRSGTVRVAMDTSTQGLARVRELMARATGDEKHEESSTSTLDALWVLYDRVLRIDPADPTAEEVAEITVMAAEEMRRFGLQPKAALLSHSNFGSSSNPSAQKMRNALPLVREAAPWLEVDGEMHGDTALNSGYRKQVMPDSPLTADANLLVCPNIDAANISYNLLKTTAGGGIAIGPVLLGAARPVHILTPSATVRRIVNMTALTAVEANAQRTLFSA